MAAPLRPADIDWTQGLPFARDFGDVYFSRAGGGAETAHVFLQQNDLPTRLAALADNQSFTIVETGFGTGLNWLATMALWQQVRSGGWLHFISVEKFPLNQADLQRAHQCWPEFAGFAQALQQDYPPALPGFHRLCFPAWQTTLTLFLGDVAEFLPRLAATADAWFLDGFAPARNPDMWQETLYRGMAGLSHAGTTFATFTAAGHVRRGLSAAGFHVEKTPGFANKREMLRGTFEKPAAAAAHAAAAQPWLQRPRLRPSRREACVIGAGIAGAQTAHRLAMRGWRVTVLERDQIASGASGNPAAVLQPRLAAADEALDHFPQQAWRFALQALAQLEPDHGIWHPCGLLQLLCGRHANDAANLPAALPAELVTALPAAQASALAGIAIPHPALWYPQAGWLAPQAYCRWLLDRPGITLRCGIGVEALEQTYDGWQLRDARGQLLQESPVVIVATACDALRLPALAGLPLQAVAGQVSQPPHSPVSASLATVLCHEGYLTPPLADQRPCLGATFHPGVSEPQARTEDHDRNREQLARALPDLAAALPATADWSGRAAVRCQSPDYLPLVGPVADQARFRSAYDGLRHGKRLPYPDLPALPGLYVNVGHGSHGFSQAALAAEILAAELSNEPAPVSRRTLDALHPLRFWARQLRRGQ